jgi:hypothetical protein
LDIKKAPHFRALFHTNKDYRSKQTESAPLAGFLGKQLHLALFAVHLFGTRQHVLLRDDHRPHLGVLAVELNPFFHVRLGVRADCVRWTLRLAHTAVDALIRVDHQHVLALVETIYRAHFDAVGVFTGDTVVVDDIGHDFIRNFVRA